MESLLRASFRLKNQVLSLRFARICCAKSTIGGYYLEDAGNFKLQEKTVDGSLSSVRSYTSYSSFSKSSFGARTFSSEANPKSIGKEDDGGLVSESELSEDEDVDAKRSPNEDISAMTKAILAVHTSVGSILDKWVEDGNEVTETEVLSTIRSLRKLRLFAKALQLSEWLESKKHIELSESLYAARVDLLAKLRGIDNAENYIKQIPESFRGELVYRTLLANCAAICNMNKMEEIFNKMKSLPFPISPFACTQMLILYKRTDRKKIADILSFMEKEDIKPSLFAYRILIDLRGQQNDINGMEKLVEKMKAEGLKTNTRIQASLANNYINAGMKQKAEAILEDLEGNDLLHKNRKVCETLMPVYATLGMKDEVERIWKICESKPKLIECVSAIEAWGKLHEIKKAEEVFDKMSEILRTPSSLLFSSLLKVYTNHKMWDKAKVLVKKIDESGCRIGPLTWDALVKLFIGAGEVEKADLLLEKVTKKGKGKPLFVSYMAILEEYSRRGDVSNSEKIFTRMRESGYVARIIQYNVLLRAYVNANVPAYGFKERMKADNVYPNREIVAILAGGKSSGKSVLSQLLD